MPDDLTHLDVLALIPPAEREALSARADAPGLWHLAAHLGTLALTSAAIAAGIPFWPLLLPVQGVLIVFLFTLQHECTHQTPFATPWLSEAVGHAAGLLLIQPFLWFRYFHLAHHRYTNDPARDPELLSGAKPATAIAFAWHVTGLPVWIGLIRQLFRNAFGDPSAPYLPARALPRLRREARLMLAAYAMILATLVISPLALWLWIVPALIGQPVLRLYLLAEHARCPTVANMLENTRTTFTTRAVRFLAWNMPYHIEHHSAPAVPFHRLPDLHRLMKPHLVTTAPGYVPFTADYIGHLGETGENQPPAEPPASRQSSTLRKTKTSRVMIVHERAKK